MAKQPWGIDLQQLLQIANIGIFMFWSSNSMSNHSKQIWVAVCPWFGWAVPIPRHQPALAGDGQYTCLPATTAHIPVQVKTQAKSGELQPPTASTWAIKDLKWKLLVICSNRGLILLINRTKLAKYSIKLKETIHETLSKADAFLHIAFLLQRCAAIRCSQKRAFLIPMSFCCVVKKEQALWELKEVQMLLFYLSVWIFYCWIIFFNKYSLNKLYSLGRKERRKELSELSTTLTEKCFMRK